MRESLDCLLYLVEVGMEGRTRKERNYVIEEMMAQAKMAEYALNRPGDRFTAEYYEMRTMERVQSRILAAKKQVELAAARVMTAR
jgi:hypothetical protein